MSLKLASNDAWMHMFLTIAAISGGLLIMRHYSGPAHEPPNALAMAASSAASAAAVPPAPALPRSIPESSRMPSNSLTPPLPEPPPVYQPPPPSANPTATLTRTFDPGAMPMPSAPPPAPLTPFIAPTRPALYAFDPPAARDPDPNRKRPLNGKDWIVDANGGTSADTNSLAAAVAAASDGDTIRVRPGTYGESVFINKSLTIVGEVGKIRPVLEGRNEYALWIQDAAVTIKDMAVTTPAGGALAVRIHDGGWLRLIRSTIASFDSPVRVMRGGTLIAEDTDFLAREGTVLVVEKGLVRLKGGSIHGGNHSVFVFGKDAWLEAEGVSFENSALAVETSDNVGALLTKCRFTNIKVAANAYDRSLVRLYSPMYDGPAPECTAASGRVECGRP